MHDSRQPVVYPNPNNRSFTIDLNFDPEEKVSISLIDLTGRIIYNSFQSIKIKSYSFDNRAPGAYLCRIEQNNIILSQDRLIIQKQ